MKTKTIFLLLTLALFAGGCNNADTKKKEMSNSENRLVTKADGEMFLLVGTYTRAGESEGIYVYKFNTETGNSDFLSMVKTANPSYLTLSSDENFVYAVEEGDEKNSAVHAFGFDRETGRLTLLNSQPTRGWSPCYIEIDADNKHVITANYGDGSISVFQVESDGSLSELAWFFRYEGGGADAERQKSSHAHSARYTPDGNYLFVTDLGSDKIYQYRTTQSVFEGQAPIMSGENSPIAVQSGTGPRHFDFHPNGQQMYLLGELSGQVLVYDYTGGNLVEKQVIAADTVGARGSADIHVSPDGRFLYASNRLKADGLAIFSINREDGTLTKVGYQPTGRHPRNFAITPNGKFLLVASRDDNKIQVFEVNAETGLLTHLNRDIDLHKPVCLKFAAIK